MTRNGKRKAMDSKKKASTLQVEDISTKKSPNLSLKQKSFHRQVTTELETKRPLNISQLSAAQFYAELEKGYKQIEEGKGIPVEVVFTELRTRYGL